MKREKKTNIVPIQRLGVVVDGRSKVIVGTKFLCSYIVVAKVGDRRRITIRLFICQMSGSSSFCSERETVVTVETFREATNVSVCPVFSVQLTHTYSHHFFLVLLSLSPMGFFAILDDRYGSEGLQPCLQVSCVEIKNGAKLTGHNYCKRAGAIFRIFSSLH